MLRTNNISDPVSWPGYPQFQAGMSVEFADSPLVWTGRAISRSGRFVCCTHPLPSEKTVEYTVLDLQKGIRGPDNYHGLGYETDEECREALECFEAATVYDELDNRGLVPEGHFDIDARWAPTEYHDVLIGEYGLAREHASVSRRNNVTINIVVTTSARQNRSAATPLPKGPDG